MMRPPVVWRRQISSSLAQPWPSSCSSTSSSARSPPKLPRRPRMYTHHTTPHHTTPHHTTPHHTTPHHTTPHHNTTHHTTTHHNTTHHNTTHHTTPHHTTTQHTTTQHTTPHHTTPHHTTPAHPVLCARFPLRELYSFVGVACNAYMCSLVSLYVVVVLLLRYSKMASSQYFVIPRCQAERFRIQRRRCWRGEGKSSVLAPFPRSIIFRYTPE